MPYRRKQYKGAAAQTTISGSLTAVATTITIASGSGWPSGATPFVATLSPNLANEESVLVTRSGTTLTVVERGYDDTSAAAHSASAAIIHSFDAASADQANRYVNQQAAKGDLMVHDGTNPVALTAGLVGDGSDDGMLLTTKNSEAGGYELSDPAIVVSAASAPSASATVYNLWNDETLDLLRVSDGASWIQNRTAYYFANIAARKAELVTPKAGQIAQLGTGILEYFNGTKWRVIGVAQFADDTARDAYFGDTTVDLYDGAQAKTLDDYKSWEYRQDEWILRNFKVTVSASAPASPHDGDHWFQPV